VSDVAVFQEHEVSPGAVTVDDAAACPTLRLAGDIDLDLAPALRQRLLQLVDAGAASTVVVDMTEVTFFDASSLGVLVAARQRSRIGGVNLVLRGASAPVLRVLRLAGLEALFTFE
jgi:anti-sigma B factor antagonist